MHPSLFTPSLVYGYVHGTGLLADVAVPDKEGRHPVVISVHGGKWASGHRLDGTSIDIEQWAKLGFFAMRIDYRLVTASPAPACYQDLMCAIRWVHAHAEVYSLDTNRIYLIGHEAGGHLVSLAATLGNGEYEKTGGWESHPDSFAGAVSISGAYELRSLPWAAGWMPPGQNWGLALDYASPVRHVSLNSRPLFMVHSDDDPVVPVQQALEMEDALNRVKAPFAFALHQGANHMKLTADVLDISHQFISQMSSRVVVQPTAKPRQKSKSKAKS